MQFIINIAILLLPFQDYALYFYTSSYDLTSFIVIFLSFFYLLSTLIKNKIIKPFAILFFFFIFYSLIFLLLSFSPERRFLSSMIWIGAYLAIFVLKKDIKYNLTSSRKLLIFTILLSTVYFWYELFFLIGIKNFNTHIKARPDSFFLEPSYAGLVYFACSLAFLNIFLISKDFKSQSINFILFLFLFVTASLTLSMHIFTFVLCLLISFVVFFNNKLYIKKFIQFLSPLAFFFIILIFVTDYDYISHIAQRLELTNISNTKSLSLLSWVRGFDQFFYVVKNYPITGTGPGSTGEFEFYSYAGELMYYKGVFDLTLKDSYSLFFRIGIEFGLVFLFLICLVIFKSILKMKKYIIANSTDLDHSLIFIYFFSLTSIIGSLIKEPNYARSTLSISLFFFFTILENIKKKYG